jgi:hypothetical protein
MLIQGSLTSVEAEIGTPVGHVQVHAPAAPGILQYIDERVCHLLSAGIGHSLTPMSQPPRAARKQGS